MMGVLFCSTWNILGAPMRALGRWFFRVPAALRRGSKADEVIAGAMASAEFLSKSSLVQAGGTGRLPDTVRGVPHCTLILRDGVPGGGGRQTTNGGLILADEFRPVTRPPQPCRRQIVRAGLLMGQRLARTASDRIATTPQTWVGRIRMRTGKRPESRLGDGQMIAQHVAAGGVLGEMQN
jgi:hypothetical protein